MARKTSAPRALRDALRGELFHALARTLAAGLDAAQALAAIRGIGDGVLDAALTRSAQAVGTGVALLHALDRQGLISAHDRPLLAAAQSSGAFEHACEQLARRYQRAAARWRQLKGKLMLPAAVLAIAILVLPLPALAAGRLGIGEYALRAAAMLMLVAMFVQLIARLIAHWRAHGTPGWLTRVARVLPVLGPMSLLHQRADAIERLALALRCGVPADDALRMMLRGEHNPVRRASLDDVRRALGAGAPLATALSGCGLLDASQFAIVSSAEGAGRLDDSLQRVAASIHDTLDVRYGVVAQWLPVVVYLCVAAMVLAGLL